MAKAPHPYADLFPMMDKKTLKELTASISESGLQDPIITFEGKVLDGRNRQIACSNAQVKPVYKRYTGDDPLGFILRVNLNRRHLTVVQRTLVAEKLENLEQGQRADRVEGSIGRSQAAELLKVSQESVKRVKKVVHSGDEDTIAAMKAGDLSITGAYEKVMKKPVLVPIEEIQSGKLLRLWDKTGVGGRKLFLQGIGATV